jgi:hypothetical protein
VLAVNGDKVWSLAPEPVDWAISVLLRKRFIRHVLALSALPVKPETITNTLLLALVGVIEIVTSVTSTMEVEVVEKLVVFIALFSCTTAEPGLAAAKVKFALSDAAVKTSPLVYVVNGMVPTLR